MPIHEYACQSCSLEFEELVRGDETVSCPKCASERTTKKLSVFGTARSNGGASSVAPAPMTSPGSCGTCGDPRGPGSCAS